MLRETGAHLFKNNTCEFTVWAPHCQEMVLDLDVPGMGKVNLESDEYGYWHTKLEGIEAGTKYRYVLDNKLIRPDPASCSQPQGVHEWSVVVDRQDYVWNDSDWEGVALQDMIIYEIHVGTFTDEGSFEGVLTKLDHLLELGVNAIEIMPIAQFPGSRNWGYDGVYPYAPQQSYGGIEGLRKMVDVCHQNGIAVILDVVYNHMGPEGNYLADFGPYFTEKHSTPWGKAFNFDDAYSDHVKSFFIQNALMWMDDFHIDGLRLDAVHAIIDNSARHFLQELRESVDDLQKRNMKRYYLIAESDMNDVRVIDPCDRGGYHLDAQWADDFHHAVHTLATGESEGYYDDYGQVWHLAKSFRQAFVYDGLYSPFRKRTIGNNPRAQPPEKFVVSIQNHDQVGNRMLGERLSQLVSFEMLKLSAGALLISPFVPLLFMGEEYGEEHPFLYFVSHGDPELVKAVQEGRANEFKYFQWKGEVPDPPAEETFYESKLTWNIANEPKRTTLFDYYKHLLSLRKEGVFLPFTSRKTDTEIHEKEKLLMIRSGNFNSERGSLLAILNFSKSEQFVHVPSGCGDWEKLLSSADTLWDGPGSSNKEIIKKGEIIEIMPESIIIYKTNK